jgi:predicted DCC family thiol-disulfide oxidoreductase YuxK
MVTNRKNMSKTPQNELMAGPQGWVLYDGECRICLTLIQRCQDVFRRYGLESATLQSDWVKQTLGYTDDADRHELLKEMRLLTPCGQVYGGADAILQIARRIRWAYPVYLLSFIPGITPLLKKSYRWIAARRHCHAEHCTLPRH